jgi:hypothetical protein
MFDLTGDTRSSPSSFITPTPAPGIPATSRNSGLNRPAACPFVSSPPVVGGHGYIELVLDSASWQRVLNVANTRGWTGSLPSWLVRLVTGTSARRHGGECLSHAEVMQRLGFQPGSGRTRP